jgi:CheY-like chemotaxis protein
VPRVLVADDNSNIQKMVALALEERGIDVVSVGNGEAAVRRIPDLAPDLVLADVFMPVRNGYEVCEFVKTNEKFSHVPVILLVGAFDPLDEKEARRVGADGVLKKPFVPPDPLIAMVTSALEKNPRVIAEMEQAREAAAPPQPELPAIALEPPARLTPKPLPDFPEPSPEEAALIYGFQKKSDEEEDSRPRFPRKDKDSDEDFDSATTARDWRRNAGEIEIPDDLNSKMAMSPDEGFPSVVFPSEHNLPHKRMPFAHDDPEEEASGSASPLSSVPGFSAIEDEAPAPPIVFSAPAEPAAPPESAVREEPESGGHPEPVAAAVPTEAPRSSDADLHPAPSEYGEDGWMSALLGRFRRAKAPEKPTDIGSAETIRPAPEPAAPIPDSSAGSTERAGAGPEAAAPSPEPVSAAPELTGLRSVPPAEKPARESRHATDDLIAPPALQGTSIAGPVSQQPENSGNDFFAEQSHGVPAAESSIAPHPPVLHQATATHESGPTFSAETTGNLLAAPADVKDDERSHFPGSFESSGPETTPVLDDGSADEPASAYAQDTSAADEDEARSFRFNSDEHVFDSAAGSGVAAGTAEEPASHGSSGERTNDRTKDRTGHDRLSSIFAQPAAEFSSPPPSSFAQPEKQSSERIPTTPPPNREALADIPFLAPPPPAPFEPALSEASKAAETAATTDSPSVDAVVNKLLEKLGPRLHEMLSKDLKPLVEDLLNEEPFTKKK